MLKLYKFRSLGDQDSFERAKEILTTGKFWCSRLWEQNDPMEGVFCFHRKVLDDSDLSIIFGMKNQHRICAFSAKGALRRPTMWGYYANGFRGIAIEIKVDDDEVTKVQYQRNAAEWLARQPNRTFSDDLRRVLTTKLTEWKNENEYRFIIDDPEPKQRIGQITAVYFGDPYGGISNFDQVVAHSDAQKDFHLLKRQLMDEAKRRTYQCFSARIEDAKVRWHKLQ